MAKKKKRVKDALAQAVKDRFKSPMGGSFKRVKFDYDKPARVRLLGNFMEMGRHIFNVGEKWYYLPCWKKVLMKNSKTGRFSTKLLTPDGGCSICKLMRKLEKKGGKSSLKLLDFLADNRKNDQVFVWNCIDRSSPRNDKGELAVSTLQHKWQVFERIHEIIDDENRGVSVSNPKRGCDLKITKKKPKGQTKYVTSRIKRTPLTEEERDMKLMDLSKINPFRKEDAMKVAKLLFKRTKRTFIEEDEEIDEDLEE